MNKFALLVLTVLLVCASPCYAVHWISTQAGPTTWTYTLQYDPFDNMNQTQSSTTITMTGLFGVTAATGPTATTFPGVIGTNMLNWVPQVLNGGTTVVWTNSSGGTGNFGSVQTVSGFTITAASAFNNNVSFATNGFVLDQPSHPSLDVSGTVAGPAATSVVNPPSAAGAPAATTLTLAIMGIGLAFAGAYAVRSRGQLSE